MNMALYWATKILPHSNYDIIQCHVVPEPTVSIHSDLPNPILSGSSPTLTCSVEMKSTVNVPVAVSMEWTGPHGTVIILATRPEMVSFTLYSSSNILDSVELADSGQYTCTVRMNLRCLQVQTSLLVILNQ